MQLPLFHSNRFHSILFSFHLSFVSSAFDSDVYLFGIGSLGRSRRFLWYLDVYVYLESSTHTTSAIISFKFLSDSLCMRLVSLLS